MFFRCEKLTELDLSGFDTSSVKNMDNMFFKCKSLTELDLSSFDTSSVEDMGNMFQSCDNLTTIYVSEKWNAVGAADSANMFIFCTKLIGGNGTFFKFENYSDNTYAVIDKNGQP